MEAKKRGYWRAAIYLVFRASYESALTGNPTIAAPAWFVDAASGYLHLSPAVSPAIDQALTLPEIVDDVDGQARPYGSAPNVGADEFFPPLWLYLPLIQR